MSEQLLTADEVAAKLQVPKRWVEDHTRSGDLPCVLLGRYRRYRESAIDEWIDERAKPVRLNRPVRRVEAA